MSPDYDWELSVSDGVADAITERGPATPNPKRVPAERVNESTFVVVGDSLYVLVRAGDFVPTSIRDYPRVRAEFTDGAWQPREQGTSSVRRRKVRRSRKPRTGTVTETIREK